MTLILPWNECLQQTRHGTGAEVGYTYLHSAVGSSRLAYTEALNDERATTTIGFYCRTRAFFAAHGFERIHRVVTDNSANYRAKNFTRTVTSLAGRHQRIKPYTLAITGRSSDTTPCWPARCSTSAPIPASTTAGTPSGCG